MTIEELVVKARQDGASDIHLIYGLPPKYRKDGQLENMCEEPLSRNDCNAYARELSGTPEAFDTYLATGELDAAD
ncbi:MAG: type IV pili twitching motility protein PilT, partial [Clostridia bacterium]|nr:type IV pili twitching motility protein PilT [Clostridia bacterium]